jgi:hypothetical protein
MHLQQVLGVAVEADARLKKQSPLSVRCWSLHRLDLNEHRYHPHDGYDHARDGCDCRVGDRRLIRLLRYVLEARAGLAHPWVHDDCPKWLKHRPLRNELRHDCRGDGHDHHDYRHDGRLERNG